jgi:hypothetical protein
VEGWNKFLEVTPDAKLRAAEVILLKLDLEARMLSATPFAEHELDHVARPQDHYVRIPSLDELDIATQDCFDLFKFEHG